MRLRVQALSTLCLLTSVATLAMASSDFDGDGRDDLAIGSRHAKVNGLPGAGLINVLYGSGNGLSVAGD
jgi:hypothetical protein